MGFSIKSGDSGEVANVDKLKRLQVKAQAESSKEYAGRKGYRFNASSGELTLTDATEQGAFYIKNNENYDFIITNIFLHTGSSTGGTGSGSLKVYISPTTGTLISNATAGSSANFLIGSANQLNANIYKGLGTITNGSVGILQYFNPALSSEKNIAVDGIVLPKGATLAISVTAPTSNTSLKIVTGISGWLQVPEVSGQ